MIEELFVVAQLSQIDVRAVLLQDAFVVKVVVVLGDLVSELAHGWNFNRAGPIRVHEAQLKDQVFDIFLAQIGGLVERYEVVRWSDTALRRQLRHQEEVETLVFIGVLDKL